MDLKNKKNKNKNKTKKQKTKSIKQKTKNKTKLSISCRLWQAKVVHDDTHDATNFQPKMHLRLAPIMAQKGKISCLLRMPQATTIVSLMLHG